MKCTYLSKGRDMYELLLLEEVNKLVRRDREENGTIPHEAIKWD